MLVRDLLPHARARLERIGLEASLLQAARLLGDGCDMLLVCDNDGYLAGLITKTDVVRHTGRCTGASCTAPVVAAMTREVTATDPGQTLQGVWNVMKTHGRKNLPVLAEDRQPLGVLNARDVLQALLQEVRHEESLLYEYTMGLGYR
mgnify:CR=1 FL=1